MRWWWRVRFAARCLWNIPTPRCRSRRPMFLASRSFAQSNSRFSTKLGGRFSAQAAVRKCGWSRETFRCRGRRRTTWWGQAAEEPGVNPQGECRQALSAWLVPIRSRIPERSASGLVCWNCVDARRSRGACVRGELGYDATVRQASCSTPRTLDRVWRQRRRARGQACSHRT